jgi:mannose-1-phosphate guanylyltransferase / mannose-6-phosphate isomerase
MNVLILAGGAGTRLWPLSQPHYSKPFLVFQDSYSLFQKTVLRFHAAPYVDEIAVVTNTQVQPLLQQQLEALSLQRTVTILLESETCGTAAAISWGCRYFLDRTQPLLVSPSDQIVHPGEEFIRCVEEAIRTFPRESIALFGIPPKYPDSGYGYIQVDTHDTTPFHQIERFIEKPTQAQIEQLTGKIYWNSGMLLFEPRFFLKERSLYSETFCDQSIDTALLERTKNIVVYPLPIEWYDVGNWDRVYEIALKDQNQNVTMGTITTLNTKGCFIMGSGKRQICTIGIEQLLIIETEEALLIAKRGESEQIKQLLSCN